MKSENINTFNAIVDGVKTLLLAYMVLSLACGFTMTAVDVIMHVGTLTSAQVNFIWWDNLETSFIMFGTIGFCFAVLFFIGLGINKVKG